MKDFVNIMSNITLMFSLSCIVIASLNIGLLDLIFYPLNRIKSSRQIMMVWFIVSALLTAIVPDTLNAILLIPMAVSYSKLRNDELDINQLLIAVGFGSAVGNDLLPYGGGNTLLGWTLLEKHLNMNIGVLSWERMFLIPTLIGLLICGGYLFLFCFKDKEIPYNYSNKVDFNPIFIIESLIMILGIILIAATNNPIYAAGFAVVALLIGKFSKSDFKSLPYKSLYIWSGAYLLGNLINVYIKSHYHFSVPSNIYTFVGILIVLILVGTMTQFITNTGIAAFTLPIILGMNFFDDVWLFTLVMKAIGISYCTIFANGCMTVSSSYGLKQKYMVKYGLPILIMQILVFGIYFYLMRGKIIL